MAPLPPAAGVAALVVVWLAGAQCAPTSVQAALSRANQTSNSNPEPCRLADVEYAHGQQVYREDPCEFCLCLDGELFCWWQDCSTTTAAAATTTATTTAAAATATTSPCRTSKGQSSCGNATSVAVSSSGGSDNYTSPGPIAAPVAATLSTKAVEIKATPRDDASSVPTTGAPTTCYVMGTQYKIGEALPRDTGTCLECVCDEDARVTCSPKDCGATQHEDYRAANSLDMFDVDTF